MSSKGKDEKKITIVDLPPELLAHIFELLAPEEICKVSQICKAFHSTSQIDSIWEKKCSELPIPRFSIQNDQLTFRQIYTKVLYKHWKLLGFWQRNVAWYGGLLHVKFDSSNGRIIGTEWNPSNYTNVRSPMYGIPVFSIVPESEQNSSQLAICGPRDSEPQPHGCQITLGKLDNGKVVEFRTECMAPNLCHGLKDGLRQVELPPTPPRYDPGDPTWIDGGMKMLLKFSGIDRYKQKYDYSRLEWPLAVDGAIIQPGLFKGDFGREGVELVMLTYPDEHSVACAKITGDVNVPSGQFNFIAELREAFVMNVEEQAHMFQLMIAKALSPPIPMNQLPEQPFRIPDQVFSDQLDLPNVCKGRFSAGGLIASRGFKNPSFVYGQWIVFNEDLFAFIWCHPKMGSLFHRVHEEF